jgi:type II secretory pathway component GspD/PulD (secretin)
VIISGLIREDQIRTVSKIPLLGDIPVLGQLFRHTSDRAQRTNLLVFVTPHIVTDMQDAHRQREVWQTAAGQATVEERHEPQGEGSE